MAQAACQKGGLVIALYCENLEKRRLLEQALAGNGRIAVARNWLELRRAAPQASCAVIGCESLRPPNSTAGQLRSLRKAQPLLTMVFVTRKDAESLREISDLPIEEVGWWDAADGVIAAVSRAQRTSLLNQIAGALDIPASPQLMSLLSLAIRNAPPFKSVAELAQASGHDRRTLARLWQQAARGRSEYRLEDVIDANRANLEKCGNEKKAVTPFG